MKFHFKCNVRPSDFWRMSLSHTYHSPLGIVNIIFTVAMILLCVNFFGKVPDVAEVLMLLGALLFPVFQPFFIYMRCKSQVLMIPADLELFFDDHGMLVVTGDKKEQVKWKRIKGMILERNMVILRVDDNNGYFLPNHTLGSERQAFVDFVSGHIN